MTSSPLESTHGRSMSGVASHTRPWKAYTIRRCWAWHAIIALGQHTRSDDVGRGMPSSPLGSTYGRTALAVACLISIGQHSWSDDVRRDMPSSLLDNTLVGKRLAWHAIITLGHHTQGRMMSGVDAISTSGHHTHDDVEHGMLLLPLDNTRGRTTLGVACNRRLWIAYTWLDNVGCGIHHFPWSTYTVGRRREWHVIIALGLHTQSNDVGRGNDIIALWQHIRSDDIGR